MAETQEERLTRLGLFNPSTIDTNEEDNFTKFKDADTIGNARIREIDALETTHGKSGIAEDNKRKIVENTARGLKFGQEGYQPLSQATTGDRASLDAELMSMKNIESGPSIYRGMDVKYNKFDDTLSEPVVASTGDSFYTQPIDEREYDKFGRRLVDNSDYASELRKQGLAVNYNANDKEKALAEVLEAKKQKLGAWGYDPQGMEDKFIKRNDGYNTYGEKPGESSFVDALQSATTKLGGKVLEGIGESVEFLGKEDQAFQQREQSRLDENYPGEKVSAWRNEFAKSIENAGKFLSESGGKIREGDVDAFYGYNKSGSKMTEDVWNELKDGKVLDAVGKISASGTLNLIAESIPEMVMYFNPATLALTYTGNVAEAKKEAEKLNGNKEISNARMSAILLGEAFSAGLESFAIGKMTGIGELTSKAGELATKFKGQIPDSIIKDATSYALNKTGKIATAMAAEGGQEVFQEGQRIATTQYGQKDLNTQANIDRIGQAFVGGSLAGGGIRTGVEAGSSVKDVYDKAVYNGINVSSAIDYTKNGINNVSEKIKPTKPSEPAVEVLDENQKAVYETNFTDAESRLEALSPLALRDDVSNDEYMSGFEEINSIKEHIIDGMKSGTIDKARSDAAVAKLKDINAKMHAGVIKMMNDGDEQAMKTLFSDPETAETKFRKIATSGSEDLDIDGANFMKAGYSAGLDDETITDIKDEVKALNKLSGRVAKSNGGTEAGSTGKSMSKVAQEVSSDARGYLSYQEVAESGIETNNTGKINKGLVAMEKFYGKHSSKLESINYGLSDAESRAEKIVSNFIDNKNVTREEALKELSSTIYDEKTKKTRNKYTDLGQIEITYGRTENKGKINIIDAIKRLNDNNYNGGMYGIRESVKNETEAMGTVFELTKKRAERIGTFAKQFTDKTEVDYVNEIKNLEPEVAKLREKVAKYKLLDEEDLSDNAKSSIKELPKMEAKLKSAQDNLAKIKGTKVDNETESATSGSENKEPVTPNEEKVSGIIDPNNPPADVSYEEPKIVEPSEPKEQEITIEDDFDGIDVSALKPIDISDMSKYPMIEFTGDNPSVMNINYADPIDPFSNYKEPTDAEIAAFLSEPVDPEYKDYADINVDNIANFDNIDSIKATTEKEKAAKSEAIKLLEAELIKAKKALSKEKEIYNALKNKITDLYAEKQEIYERNSGKKQWNEDDSNRIEWLNEQTESAKQYLPRFVNEKINFKKELINGITSKLSGSAEIESIIKDTGLGSIVSEKTKMIEKDKDGNDKYQIIKSSDIVKGNKKATNRLSGMKIEDITDNKTVLDYADSAIETLSNVIDKVEKKYNKFGKEIESDKILTDVNGIESGLKEVQKLRDSLFRGILFNADGSINKNVATAIAMTGDEYRALMASKLAFKTKEYIAKMLGITEGEVTGLMTRTMTFNGSFKKIIADDLSTTLFKNLAISGVDTADKELVAKMKADAGQIVLLYMQEKGYIEPLATSTMTVKEYETMMEKDEDFAKETFTELGESENGATIPMVRLAGTRDANGNQIRLKGKAKEAHNKAFTAETAKITKTLDILGSTFGIESTKKGYKTKPSKTDSKKVKNSKVNNMSDKALKTMNVLQAESFEMNGGVEVLFELDENGNRLIDDATILKAMGYKTEEDLKGKSFNTVESAEARNMEIANSLDELKSLRARVLDPEDEMTNEMYFDYFFGKNGRFYMDSVGINPQTEKQLHRWLITPKSHNVTIDFNSKDGKAKRQKDMFRLAIAQAFGFAIDKKSNADSYAFADAIMASDESELLKVLKPNEKGKFEHTLPGSEHTLEIEHIGHTMQAINALRAYRDAKGGTFTTSMSVEFDAVTSGFIIKLMQMPILGMKLVKEWLAKGGVFLGGTDGYNGGDIKDIKSMSDVIAKNGITDAYRTLAGKMKTPKEVTDKYYENHKDRNNKVKVANRVLSAITPLLGNIKNDIDEVTKEGRALFKDPFMTFNYAAGMASIKRSLGYKMTENLADEMLAGSEKGNVLISALFGKEATPAEIASFRKDLAEKDFDEVVINGKVKVSELMRKIIEDAYGNQVESILGEEFEGLVKANGTINNAFKGVFLAWKKEYNAKVAEVISKGGVLSSKVEDEIILDLKDKFPMINAPLSSGNIEDLETVAIYSTKLSSGKDKRYGAAKTYINKDNANNPKGQQTLTVQSMIRELDAAMSAGAVIPIHYIDGSFMTNVLEASGVLGVHDAVVTGMDNAFDTVKNYNKNVYENSRDYSVIEELSKLVNRNAKGNESIVIREAKGDNEAITFGDIVNDLNKLNAEVKEARRVLFNTDVKVMHMTAIDDTDYSEIDGQGTVKKANELVEYAEPDVGETTNKKLDSTQTPGSDDIVKESANLVMSATGLIKFNSDKKNGVAKGTKTIETYDEFKSIVEEYNSLLNKSGKTDTNNLKEKYSESIKYIDELFVMLGNAGIKFRPFDLKLIDKVDSKGEGLGLHKTDEKNGQTTITMPSKVNFGDYYPLKVVLHEYAHSITVKGMKDNKALKAKANKLRAHIINEIKNNDKKDGIDEKETNEKINRLYGLNDINVPAKDREFEFIAEILTDPQLQKIVAKISSIGQNKNALEDIKIFFKAIVKFVTRNNEEIKETNSLIDALDIVLEIQNENGLLNKDYNSEPEVHSADDIVLINESLDIMNTLKKDTNNSNLRTIFESIIEDVKGCKQ